jgi:hypothetical protein
VFYTADTDFRGVDTFHIEVNYRRWPRDVDTFAVNVQ